MKTIDHLPPWLIMWLLTAAVFLVGKVLTLGRLQQVGVGRQMGYLFWVGMDPLPWRKRRMEEFTTNLWEDWLRPVLFTVLGIILVWGLARHGPSPLIQGWCGMIGLICLLHFGLFHLLASGYRKCGIAVQPIMQKPIKATTLADFWGQRWNRAFHDLAYPYVFKTVQKRWGLNMALVAVFLVSGIAHDLLISVPAGAGYGLPTCYFLLQAAGIFIQRQTGWKNWFFTHAFTALPAVVLFHPPFVEKVMLPFFQTLHALP